MTIPDNINEDILTSARRLAELRNCNNWNVGNEIDADHLEEIELSRWFLQMTPDGVAEEMAARNQHGDIAWCLRCAFSMSGEATKIAERFMDCIKNRY